MCMSALDCRINLYYQSSLRLLVTLYLLLFSNSFIVYYEYYVPFILCVHVLVFHCYSHVALLARRVGRMVIFVMLEQNK